MNYQTMLQLIDAERQTLGETGCTLEKTPYVVRAIGRDGSWACIVYSHFSKLEAKQVITHEIDYFAKLDRGFEWKVYSHDEPSDLLARLCSLGFKIGDEEALMVLDLKELPPALLELAPESVGVKAVMDDQKLADFLALESAIWNRSHTTRELLLGSLSDPLPCQLGFVAYADKQPIGFGRVTTSRQGCFAGLWGGSVLPDFRGRGVYRALLSARIKYAKQFGSIRYLRVDALPTSRPILEKYGFKTIGSTWPADWSPVSH
jgi:GNAT superfamily N-acetyltransferase